MSFSDSEVESVKKRHRDEEEWADDVSILSRYEGASPSVVIFKIALAILMITACSGALVYSIINSEEKESEVYKLPALFPMNISQECQEGTLLMTYRTGGNLGTAEGYNSTQYGSAWVQDASKKRLYHRVGLTNKDWLYTFFVYDNVIFFQTKGNCTQLPGGYEEFLDSFGFDYMQRQMTELLMIDGEYTEVMEYEGEPPTNVTVFVVGAHPSLVRGYANTEEPLTYGWDLYFAHTANTEIYKMEYFYPTMSRKNPNFSVFDDLPEECLNKT